METCGLILLSTRAKHVQHYAAKNIEELIHLWYSKTKLLAINFKFVASCQGPSV